MDLSAILASSVSLIPKAMALVSGAGKEIVSSANYDFGRAHERYCASVIDKYCRARTFFVRDRPQYLDEFYVPSTIRANAAELYPRANLATLDAISGMRTIVTGTGGSGKTIFMRHLLLDSIESGVAYPVFIELRNLSDDDYSNIEGAVIQFMLDHNFPLDESYARKSIADGLLVILLDGFDEVPTAQRKKLERSIKKMMAKAKSRIIISSRPDMVLEGWDSFTTAKIEPLSLDDACELLEKIRYEGEEETKQRFILSLRESLFHSHQYFLSNPLLLSIMLLTYGDSANIPTQFSRFYESAFIALFQKHDALKSGYQRERLTNLDIYGFARLFSSFCAVTYHARRLKFSQLQANSFMKQAKLVAGLPEVNSEAFIEDAKQAVCLFMEDGLDVTFVHRSFQEYFTARFIHEANDEVRKSYFNEITADWHRYSDNVTMMLYEMNPNFVEDHYFIPELNRIFGDRKRRKLTRTAWAEMYLAIFSDLIWLDTDLSYAIKDQRGFTLMLLMAKIMPKIPKDIDSAQAVRERYPHSKISIKKLTPKSRQIHAIGEIKGEFGVDFFELLRTELLTIEKRAASRQKAISKAFHFN